MDTCHEIVALAPPSHARGLQRSWEATATAWRLLLSLIPQLMPVLHIMSLINITEEHPVLCVHTVGTPAAYTKGGARPCAGCSYTGVKGRSHTAEKRISMHPHKPHATSQPSRFSHTPRLGTDSAHDVQVVVAFRGSQSIADWTTDGSFALEAITADPVTGAMRTMKEIANSTSGGILQEIKKLLPLKDAAVHVGFYYAMRCVNMHALPLALLRHDVACCFWCGHAGQAHDFLTMRGACPLQTSIAGQLSWRNESAQFATAAMPHARNPVMQGPT